MLAAANRLALSSDFALTVRAGRRAGRGSLVVHLLAAPAQCPPRVGLVVSRAVGGACTRNLVKRRLRHLVRERLERLPVGCSLVVRALPTAASCSYATLGADLDRALTRVLP